MNDALRAILGDWLLAQADDQLLLAHRASAWTGHAPILEEDIALANIAQDELGHATLCYQLLTDLRAAPDDYPDQLVFHRRAAQWRNVQLAELPNGDWAFTMLRQFFFDAYEQVVLERLQQSALPDLAAIAGKARREELYHLRHTSAWIKRLALGTDESRRRTMQALDVQWPYLAQLFTPLPGEALLVAEGYVPDALTIKTAWQGLVLPLFETCGLEVLPFPADVPARTEHTPHLAELLDDMQEVARLDPEAEW